MDNHPLPPPPRSNVEWTPQAYECHTIGGDCAQCSVTLYQRSYLNVASQCRLKETIPLIVQKYGPPVLTDAGGHIVKVRRSPDQKPTMKISAALEYIIKHITQHPGSTTIDIAILTGNKLQKAYRMLSRAEYAGRLIKTKTLMDVNGKPHLVSVWFPAT